MARIASQFVDLALKHGQGDMVNELKVDEVGVLFATVSAAGFDPKEIVPGKLIGNYLDEDGSNTGEHYLINRLCPFKVVSQENKDHYSATGWLDCALRRVVFGATRQNESRDQLIKAIAAEIKRSVPLGSIQLTPESDRLCEYPPVRSAFGLDYFVDHTRDDHNLGSCVGVHERCNGWMDRHAATKTHDAIVCRKCHLRVLFPKQAKTYGELRQALAPQGAKISA